MGIVFSLRGEGVSPSIVSSCFSSVSSSVSAVAAASTNRDAFPACWFSSTFFFRRDDQDDIQ
jgi:hypothetical protein